MPKTRKRPLSKSQQEVLDLMKDGWELATTTGIDPTAWLQQGGAGRGGATKDVHYSTLYALRNRGFIDANPTQSRYASPLRYVLTDDGRNAV